MCATLNSISSHTISESGRSTTFIFLTFQISFIAFPVHRSDCCQTLARKWKEIEMMNSVGVFLFECYFYPNDVLLISYCLC